MFYYVICKETDLIKYLYNKIKNTTIGNIKGGLTLHIYSNTIQTILFKVGMSKFTIGMILLFI